MKIRKIGNLYQVVKESIGSVFQSHSMDECRRYMASHSHSICTLEWKDREVSRPLKYSNIIKA